MPDSQTNVTDSEFPRSVAIYGVGLIGGSLSLALKRFRPQMPVWGVDAPEVLERAQRLGVIDEGAPVEPDLIVLATPVGQILQLIDELPEKTPLVLDVGSTKVAICRRAAQRSLRFIGGHPMTGRERSGPEAASADLFVNAQFFLCDIPQTPARAMEQVEALLRGVGAIPVRLSAEEHDRLVAEMSHLPQMLSAILADQTAQTQAFAGPGWETWTRLAASPFHVWRDILATSGFLPEAMESFARRLEAALDALKAGRLDDIEAIFERANRAVARDRQ
ncbi:MAG TPA: prephenate dehydrogenase/arogenate dehydrogenase family protein [Terriglobia bacterium]|nr:prephenate dehydrogenase/arogenate dehydrogenase family protein [Terriglobia bacterium]